MVKAAMDSTFEQNAIRPGHPEYKYDLQCDFLEQGVRSGWDSSEDDG